MIECSNPKNVHGALCESVQNCTNEKQLITNNKKLNKTADTVKKKKQFFYTCECSEGVRLATCTRKASGMLKNQL